MNSVIMRRIREIMGKPNLRHNVGVVAVIAICGGLLACQANNQWVVPFANASTDTQKGGWIADVSTGCRVWNPNPSPGETIKWSGACSNNLATGKGTVQWYLNGKPGNRDEGDFVDGKSTGKYVSVFPDGGRFEGEFPEGKYKGVYVFPNGLIAMRVNF